MIYRDNAEKARIESDPLVIQAREHLRKCEDAAARFGRLEKPVWAPQWDMQPPPPRS